MFWGAFGHSLSKVPSGDRQDRCSSDNESRKENDSPTNAEV